MWEAPISPLDSGPWKFIASLHNVAANAMSQNLNSGRWTWSANSNGCFDICSAWNMVRTPPPVFELYSLVWFPSNGPKMACCLLRALKNRL